MDVEALRVHLDDAAATSVPSASQNGTCVCVCPPWARSLTHPCPRLTLLCLTARALITVKIVVGTFAKKEFNGFWQGVLAGSAAMIAMGQARITPAADGDL
jgi:hypothetical protein